LSAACRQRSKRGFPTRRRVDWRDTKSNYPQVAVYLSEGTLRRTIDCIPTTQPGVYLVNEPIGAAEGEAVVIAFDEPTCAQLTHSRTCAPLTKDGSPLEQHAQARQSEAGILKRRKSASQLRRGSYLHALAIRSCLPV